MVIAQGLIEYAVSSGMAGALTAAEQTGARLQASVQAHPFLWLGAVLMIVWLLIRR